MFPIEIIDESLRARSRHERRLLLTCADARAAIEQFARAGWAPHSVTRRLERGREIHEHGRERVAWSRGESYEEYVQRCAQAASAAIESWSSEHPEGAPLVELDAWPPDDHTSRTQTLLTSYFAEDADSLLIDPELKSVPLVAARVRVPSAKLDEDQKVYIYDVIAGAVEHVRVVGRLERSCFQELAATQDLDWFRPQVVYEPALIRMLHGHRLDRQLFMGHFWPMPS